MRLHDWTNLVTGSVDGCGFYVYVDDIFCHSENNVDIDVMDV